MQDVPVILHITDQYYIAPLIFNITLRHVIINLQLTDCIFKPPADEYSINY